MAASTLVGNRTFIIEHNGFLYRYTEVIERIASNENSEVIDLTNDDDVTDRNQNEATIETEISAGPGSPAYTPSASPYSPTTAYVTENFNFPPGEC